MEAWLDRRRRPDDARGGDMIPLPADTPHASQSWARNPSAARHPQQPDPDRPSPRIGGVEVGLEVGTAVGRARARWPLAARQGMPAVSGRLRTGRFGHGFAYVSPAGLFQPIAWGRRSGVRSSVVSQKPRSEKLAAVF